MIGSRRQAKTFRFKRTLHFKVSGQKNMLLMTDFKHD